MDFLIHLFSTPQDIAKEAQDYNLELIKEWDKYVQTVPKKIILADSVTIDAPKLIELIRSAIEDIAIEEGYDEKLLNDLNTISHEARIKRVDRLEEVFRYAETKYKYILGLVVNIHSTLKAQLHLANSLNNDSGNQKLIGHIRDMIKLETAILQKINHIDQIEGPETFKKLFFDLVRGEAVIKNLDKVARRHLKKMQAQFQTELEASITYQWVTNVLDYLEDSVHEAVAQGLMDYHANTDFEFVNRSMFVDLVRRSIIRIKPRGVSERMIDIFVHDFRQGFNVRKLD